MDDILVLAKADNPVTQGSVVIVDCLGGIQAIEVGTVSSDVLSSVEKFFDRIADHPDYYVW